MRLKHAYTVAIVFFATAIVVWVYRGWFLAPEIIGGDWPYYFAEAVKEKSFPPPVWVYWQNNGLGGVDPVRGLHTFESFLAVVGTKWLGLPWPFVYKIGWFGLFLLLSFVSPALLYRTLFGRGAPVWQMALAGVIYSTNTYILMVASGGQMGVALGYSVAPLVLTSFIKINDQRLKIKDITVSGLLLGFQVMIDSRIAYVTMIAAMLYYLLLSPRLLLRLAPPIGIGMLVNAFWLLPVIKQGVSPLATIDQTLTSADALGFFSFADFSHAISLLHPNWPENIFGKTYFLQPEFLFLPLLAFASLSFIHNPSSFIKYFAFLGLIGAFLGKGVNPPFGDLYRWLFTNVPGFALFRDPTKFYQLIAMAYAILIPSTLARFRVAMFFLIVWTVLVRQAIFGQLGGTFAPRTVPQEYVRLKDMLASQEEFFRTLWVPRLQRFGFSSKNHPAIEAQPLFAATSAGELADAFSRPGTRELLETLAVQYVFVPYDVYGEIFQEDRQYSLQKRKDFESVLDAVPWLVKTSGGTIPAYQRTVPILK